MSAHDDWAAVDAMHVSLPTIVSSTDLFDGELFGDELIDIYNSTVEEHGHGTGHLPFKLHAILADVFLGF
jgi:hypothetical protein